MLFLATSLRKNGIEAILDKWHLREGQDTLAFMEGMVSDSSISKVLMICDRGYVERANKREGGVGTEAQIISAKVYNNTAQRKFAAVVVELDADGVPLLPHYMSTRLYFDMSSREAEALNFEKLVRWIFDKPFHAAPPVAERPSFLDKEHVAQPRVQLETQRLRLSTRQASANSASAAEALLDSAAEEVPRLIVPLKDQPDKEQVVYDAIKGSFEYLEALNSGFIELIRSKHENVVDVVNRFFERIISFWDYAPENTTFTRWDNDVLRYVGHEALVSFVAIAMNERAFELAAEFLAMPMFKPRRLETTGEPVMYTSVGPYLESLESRNQRAKLNRISLHADLINEHHEHSVVRPISFIEADLLLYSRGLIDDALRWYPVSAIYVGDSFGSLPTFARATSARFYEKLKPLLLGLDATAFREKVLSEYAQRKIRTGYREISIPNLLNLEKLGTAN